VEGVREGEEREVIALVVVMMMVMVVMVVASASTCPLSIAVWACGVRHPSSLTARAVLGDVKALIVIPLQRVCYAACLETSPTPSLPHIE
jgi:type II secretory pathway component PulK